MRTILNKCSFAFLSLISVLMVSALPLAGCGDSVSTKPVVVGTTTQVADLVKEVAGNRLKVVSLVGPNADAHEFEPRARDVEAIADAKVVFTSGAGIDSWADGLIENSGGDARKIQIFRPLPVKLKPKGSGAANREFDPHWWGSTQDVVAAVNQIEDILSEEFPSDAGTFKEKARKLRQEVYELDARIAKCFKRIPKSKRKLITNHSAFTYFTNQYGFDYAGSLIPSLSTEAQPSAGEIRKLVKKIRAEKIPAIFTESSVSPKLAKAVARDAGVKVEGPLYIDSLGPRGSSTETWIGATRHNARAILVGLGGAKAERCL